MIRHGYTGCMPCHTDPSGGAGALDGIRARAERSAPSHALRREHRLRRGRQDVGLLWGLVPLPDAVRLGRRLSRGLLQQPGRGRARAEQQFITMRADLYGRREGGTVPRRRNASATSPQGDLLGGAHDESDRQPHLARALGRRRARRRRRVAAPRRSHRAPLRDPDDRAHALGAQPHRGRTSTTPSSMASRCRSVATSCAAS